MVKELQEQHTRLLTRTEVAEIFQVSPATVTRWAESGKLPSIKTLGGHRRYEDAVIQELSRQLAGGAPLGSTLLTIPKLYADHHVTAVRSVLTPLPGVVDVWASSAWGQVEVTYNRQKITADDIVKALEDAGYPPEHESEQARAEPQPVVMRVHDPAWDVLGVRVTHTNSLDLEMSSRQ